MPRTLLWLKHDWRWRDHGPLALALQSPQALALGVIEPQWLDSPECAPRHVRAQVEVMRQWGREAAQRGLPFLPLQGDMLAVLTRLHAQWPFERLLSHEETGTGWSYARDLAVQDWCQRHGVRWEEHRQWGVIRRLKSRQAWAGRWERMMDEHPCEVPLAASGGWGADDWARLKDHMAPLRWDLPSLRQQLAHRERQDLAELGGDWLERGRASSPGIPSPDEVCGEGAAAQDRPRARPEEPGDGRPPADPAPAWHFTLPALGPQAAHHDLQTFLGGRGSAYRKAMSSPLSAETGCSRLSVHLAQGTLSMREVHQATELQMLMLDADDDPAGHRLAWHLRGFASRLRWHCHFIQKLESQPDIEFLNLSRSGTPPRPGDGQAPWTDADEAKLLAWRQGRTGLPMIDACMRYLNATGWLNFRMRAMLASFSAYQLWLHWRRPGLHLARQFLDFEPGIHWCQMQMQSGTTGINTLRIYSPVKQSQDQDPQGRFIRRWVPELAKVPLAALHEPWRHQQALADLGCRLGTDYPLPIVDPAAAMKAAKEACYPQRRDSAAREEAARIQAQHGSRKSGLKAASRRTRRAARQEKQAAVDAHFTLPLFDEDPGHQG